MNQQKAQKIVRKLFASQSFGVLATQEGGQPYATLVAFAPTDDMQYLLFVTERSTTKFAHIKKNPRVAILIDNRSNHPRDVCQAAVVTVLGEVTEIVDNQKKGLMEHYLAKHPFLEDFARAPSSTLLALTLKKIVLVTKFQHVVEWDVNECNNKLRYEKLGG